MVGGRNEGETQRKREKEGGLCTHKHKLHAHTHTHMRESCALTTSTRECNAINKSSRGAKVTKESRQEHVNVRLCTVTAHHSG